MAFINWKLMAHPLNWVVILAMLTLAAIGGHLFLSYMGVEPATSDNTQTVPAPNPGA